MSAAQYRAQVGLLVRMLPLLASEPDFALKGGSAINLFWRDLPRLSVDLDLTDLPLADSPTALAAIEAGLRRLAGRMPNQIAGAVVDLQGGVEGGHRLLVRPSGTQVKIGVTLVLRGVVFSPEVRTVSSKVENAFGYAEANLARLKPARRQALADRLPEVLGL